MTPQRLCLVAFAAICLGAGPAHADDTADVLAKIQKKATTHERVAFDLEMDMSFGVGQATGTGMMGFADEKRVNVMTMNMNTMGQQMTMTMHTVMDEDLMLSWNSMLNVVQKVDMKAVREQAPDMPMNKIDSPAGVVSTWDPETLDYIGEEDLNGEKTGHFIARDLSKLDVSQLSPSEGMPMGDAAASMVELWIGMEDGLPRRLELKGNDGQTFMSQTFTNFRFGSDVPDDLFELSPPAGAQTLDMTQQTIAMWKSGGIRSNQGMAFPGGQ